MIFLFQPATDESVDPDYELRNDDYSDTGITVQDCRSYGGGYAVNEHGGDGQDFWMRQVGEFRSLKAAKAAALDFHKLLRGATMLTMATLTDDKAEDLLAFVKCVARMTLHEDKIYDDTACELMAFDALIRKARELTR